MGVTIQVKGLDSLSDALESLPLSMQAGVKVAGEAADYALVWELGYATRVIQPGPKTTWSTNPLGEAKVLTIVAPTGYIRVNRFEYDKILREEFKSANLAQLPISAWPEAMKEMLNKAAERCAEVIRNAAPVDTGQLRSEIVPAPVGDGALADMQETSYDLESDWVGGL